MDKELRQKIGGEKFDSMCYRKNYGKIGGLNYVEKCITLFENVNVLQVALVDLFILDYQAS